MIGTAGTITRAIWFVFGIAFGFAAGAGWVMRMENSMSPETRSYPCLPDDKCLLHIVPFGKPHSALTCDLNANKCWDDRP